ncbi:hypothetical protein P7H46_03140 [Enterococcus pseudoavium]|uniref:Uncharacterized protein n=1 Tax=Enterococcus pseudoavium TaxID=44007 RepID=A0ABU3FFM1_9ENTE|nr:hypothetical protein [Enterococcus pseudoavium]MDT2755216.1 hypothetical protein [Enterococcus pseudoavium]MDT2769834.1 hypothetical protein [Enterococcus pseudoavium]
MNTYLKIQRNESQEHYNVSLYFSNNQLMLTRPQGFRHPSSETLHLTDIKNIIIAEFLGSPIISFFYQDRRYTFYESGPAVTEYLKENLAI